MSWPDEHLVADAELVHYVEVQLAGAIGAASARVMVASVAKEEALTVDLVIEGEGCPDKVAFMDIARRALAWRDARFAQR